MFLYQTFTKVSEFFETIQLDLDPRYSFCLVRQTDLYYKLILTLSIFVN